MANIAMVRFCFGLLVVGIVLFFCLSYNVGQILGFSFESYDLLQIIMTAHLI